jgi:hypothetical protein
MGVELLELDGPGPESARHLRRALDAPAGDRQVVGAPALEGLRGSLADLARAEDQHLRVGRLPKMLVARSTATLATLTRPDEIPVWVRTCLAAWKAFWKSRLRTAPVEPDACAAA